MEPNCLVWHLFGFPSESYLGSVEQLSSFYFAVVRVAPLV